MRIMRLPLKNVSLRKVLAGLIFLLVSSVTYAQIPETMPVPGCVSIPTNPAPSNPQAVVRYRTTLLSWFATIETCQFANNPYIDAIVQGMTPMELARLSQLIDQSKQYDSLPQVNATSPGVPQFLDAAAAHLSASSLVKIRAAFGGADTDAAVQGYAPAAVQSVYFSSAQLTPYETSRAQVISVGQKLALNVSVTMQGAVVPNPSLDMTVYEIYLEFRTAGWSVSAAMTGASKFIGTNITLAFSTGYAIGTGLYWLSDQVTPGINIWVEDQVGSFVSWACDSSGDCTAH